MQGQQIKVGSYINQIMNKYENMCEQNSWEQSLGVWHW